LFKSGKSLNVVNLSNTVADLTSPQGVERFNLFYEGYSKTPRLAGAFKTLHVFQAAGEFYSVDFGLVAKTLEDLGRTCESRLLSISPDSPIPTQPRELWWEFWRRPLVQTAMRFPMRTHRRSSVFLAVRSL
jgi:hypothetical protein